MAENSLYDLCIIGAGLFGSAAARYASANPGIKVCLVGTAEPTSVEFPNREFGAQYDEGRVTRILDDKFPCEVLAQDSISRYRELERLSGIKFYTPVGCLFTGPRNGRFMQGWIRNGALYRVPLIKMDANEDTFHRRYPYLHLQDEDVALLDDSGGGYISPRNLVAAQKKMALEQGCHIIEGVVCGRERDEHKNHVIKTTSGLKIKAKRLLITAGGFVCLNRMDILKPLAVKRVKETVILLQLPEEEVRRLSAMPSMLSAKDNSTGVYILPPIEYPDGKYYLKIGKLPLHEEDDSDVLKSLEELLSWYMSDGDSDIESYLQLVSDLIPGLRYNEVSRRTCATCNTPTGLPYIDRVEPTIYVAVAGNGKGAKFSDEVGRIAAHLSLTGQWDAQISPNHFQAVFH